MIELVETSNPKFKYLEGTTVEPKEFKIGVVVWFGHFHTSSVQRINYRYTGKSVFLEVGTLNSKYIFKIKGIK